MRIYAFAVSALLALAGCAGSPEPYYVAAPATLDPSDVARVAEYIRPASRDANFASEYNDCDAIGTSITATASAQNGGDVVGSNGGACTTAPIRRRGESLRRVVEPPAPQAVTAPLKSASVPTEAKTATATPAPAPAPVAEPMEENILDFDHRDCASLAQVQNPSQGIRAILAQCAGGAEPPVQQGAEADAGFPKPVLPPPAPPRS